ncbi:MAG: hypothetical protein ACPGRH_02140 [Alphaproteobacteria bacterium]
MKSSFRRLDLLGKERLSKHFQFRQFLYSEAAIALGLINEPDDPELALEAGRKLCENILEPLVDTFGPIIVRSGYRSSTVNAAANKNGMGCGPNPGNYAYHIWDRRNAAGQMGAAACIIVPAFNEGATKHQTWEDFAWWLDETFDHNGIEFFRRDFAFNIGWAEVGDPYIFTTRDGSRYIKGPNQKPPRKKGKTAPSSQTDKPQGDLI